MEVSRMILRDTVTRDLRVAPETYDQATRLHLTNLMTIRLAMLDRVAQRLCLWRTDSLLVCTLGRHAPVSARQLSPSQSPFISSQVNLVLRFETISQCQARTRRQPARLGFEYFHQPSTLLKRLSQIGYLTFRSQGSVSLGTSKLGEARNCGSTRTNRRSLAINLRVRASLTLEAIHRVVRRGPL